MRAIALVLALALVSIAFAPRADAIIRKKHKKPKKSRAPRQPRVSPARRARLMSAIEEDLASSRFTVENPGALVPFFERLYRLSHGTGEDVVSILHYGDSHTAADIWTGELRTLFQSKFGNAGAGFSHAGRPWNSYRRTDVRSHASDDWYTNGLYGREGDGMYGLAGASSTTNRPDQWVSLDAEGPILEVWYLQQPGGGRLELTDAGQPVSTITTDGPAQAGYFHSDATPGEHHYELRTLDAAPVRLFGWVTGFPRGVTYEMLGINGAQAFMILEWNQQVLADNIARRNPALIVLAYGTNEASNPHITEESCRDTFRAVIQRMREAAPQASILLIGPPDRSIRQRFWRWRPYTNVSRIVHAERAVANEMRCSFYDWRGKMGGTGVMNSWVAAGLAQGDHVHFTGSGYQLIARALFADLMKQYEVFLKARTEAPEEPSAPELKQ